ncbi:hypothetical protein [Celeribacter persicus]|nr:hypothetical protein [Celeribacter persicus]
MQVLDLPPPMPMGALHLHDAPLNDVILSLIDASEKMARKLI